MRASLRQLPTSMAPSSLPPELWIHILRSATEVPGLLDNELNPSGRVIGHSIILETKKAVVSVCRLWRVIGIDFLYEYLCLTTAEEHDPDVALCGWLADLFTKHAGEARGYGRATKRIDFDLILLWEENVNAFFRLLRSVKDLNVLVALPGESDYGVYHENALIHLSSLMEERFSHSLWRLVAYFFTHHFTSRGRLSYTKHLPRLPLRALEIGMDDCTEEADEPPFALSTVSTFGINVSTSVHTKQCPKLNCPNLKHLLLRQVVDGEIAILIPFLRRHGSQVLFLEIKIDHATFLSDVGKILEHTPHIRRLSLGFLNFDSLDVPPLPALTDIILESIFTAPATEDQHVALSYIMPLLADEQTPRLETVTMLEDWDEQCSRVREGEYVNRGFQAWETFYNACRSRQVTIVDRNGRALPERMSI